LPRAVSLADEILNNYANKVGEFNLIPSTGGVFEVSFEGDLIFSKKDLGRFPEDGEIMKLLESRIS
jgi:selenoprotein W-related protein